MVNKEDTKTEIAILKKDLDLIAGLTEKFDAAIDQLTIVANSVDKMLAVHELRLENQEKQAELMNTRFAEFKKEIMGEIQELRAENSTQHEKVNNRLSKLEHWRWYIVGIATVVGFVVAKLPIDKLFFH